MYKAALIGCGNRASAHIDAYDLIDDARVVACCAPSPVRREALAARYRLKAYADAADMIVSEQPDIVHIVTWPHTRIALMELVAERGVPLCTVEKPVATAVRDWEALKRLCERSRTKFAVCHQFRWHPNLIRCREAAAKAAIGAVRLVEMSGGMNIAGQGTHTLNYGRSLIGEARVAAVFAAASGWDRSDPGHPAPEATEAYLTFENGTRGLWTSGPVSPSCGDPGVYWQHVRVAAYGERGQVGWEEFGHWGIATPQGVEGGHYGDAGRWESDARIAQAGFHRSMLTWMQDGGKPPSTSLEQSLHEWHAVLALYQSSLEKRSITLAGFIPHPDLIERLSLQAG